ncbi:phage tail tape measure protein [uncultured Prevotella sp.]|uniref:phage tail tape measure protein n=1 Tax=uncultured Prevotella sp. TaxID=159272 RepID=UPI00266BE169|nr:phage tail tape measure protein [uncultured Prevotella sp.]
MATQRLAKVVITANASTAKKVLEEIDALVQKYTADIQKMTAAGQANTAECKQAERTLKALSQVQRDNIEDTKRLGEVVQDLANTKLRDLRRAMGSGKSALAGLTGSDADLKRAEQIRSEMKQVGDQMRLIEGQYVKIADGLKNVSNQSDQWLDKAIKQQRDLVGSLQKSDASYQQNLATLKQLEAEEDRRKGKMGIVEARQTVTSQNASASDLRRAKTTLTEARDNTPTGNSADIAKYNSELQEIEKRLEAVSGKTQKASMSWKQMKQVLAEPNKASGEDIKRTMEVIQQKIQQLPAGSKYVADLRRQYSMLEQTLKGTRMSQSALNDILARSKQGKASLDELRRAYKQLEEELNQINTKSKEFADKQKSMKELKKNIDEATGAAHKQGGAWQTALKNLTAYVGLFAVFNQLKTYLFDIFRLNAKFAEQLTNIRKVALSTTEDVAQLSKELSKIDTRTSLEELNNLAYAGAKLGIQTQNLAGFVRAADQVNVALKEDLGDEALTSLAKITEVMGLIDKYGVEEAMLKTGSAIFRLASTSTASSGKIVDFSNRLLALGDAATLTTPDILAIGSAVDSMALEPEVAATAFGKLVVELRKGTSSIEKDLGIAQGSLKKKIEEGKGMEAIQTIFHKMHESDNVFALNSLFKDLGSEDGARLTKVMVTMAEKVGMLDKAVAESNKAFREGSAVTVEYEMQQETAAAYMERAANLFEKQFVSADAASGPVRDLAKAWYEMVDALVHNITFMTEVRMLIMLLMTAMKLFLSMLPTLVTMLGTAGVAGAFAKLAELTTGLTGKTMSLANAWNVMYSSFKKLSFVGQMSVMGGLIGLAGVLVVKLAQWTASLKQVSAGQRVLNEVQEEGKRKAMEEQESLKRLRRVMHDTSASMDLRRQAMAKLNSAIPNLNAKINSETGAVQENTKAWEENFKRLQNYYELEGARAKLAELGRKKVDAILKLQQKEDAYANTNVDITTGPVTSSGAMVAGQASGAAGQAMQKAAAKRERDKAQQEYNDIVAQEDALYKKFGAKLDVKGKKVGGKGKKVGGGGGGNAEAPEDDSRTNISEFITKINNFYERQKTAMIEKMTEDGVEKDLQDYAVAKIENRLNAALAAAKQSLVLGTKAWDDFKASMDKDLKEKDDEYGQSQSRMLKDAIQSTDVMKLRSNLLKQMPKIKKGQMVGLKSDERDRAYLDRLWLEESKSEDKQATLDQKQAEQRRKELLEHDYTGIVQQNSFLGLAKTGFVDIDINEIDRDRDAIIKVLEKARNNIVGVFQTGGEKDSLLKFLFGENYEDMPMQFLSLLDVSEEDMRLFYQKLIQYNDEYESASKKGDDERKRLNDYDWSKTDYYKEYQKALPGAEQEVAIKGSYRNAGQRMGMESVSASDPELELMKARMEFAQRYYTFLEEHNATEQQLADARKSIMAEQANYAKKLTGDMFEQYNSLLTFMGPLQTFGESVGDAFATMTENASEGRKALKTALKQMIKAFATNTLQMISQQQIDRAQTTAHYTQLLLMQQAFGTAKVEGEAATGAALLTAKTVNNNTEEQLEVAHQEVMAALRSAGIFGWCVSTLGPIAGPIAYSAMMAILMGLLNFAISKVGGSDKSKNETAKGKNTKVVSGMLTYDSGNVQDLRPFVGNDGSLYWASEDNKPHDGVSLLTQPTATTINGQPSLVAENGPELVIGRETTQAMMMNNPQLLKALVNYDRNYSGRRAYDNGNVAETSPTVAAGASVSDEMVSVQANTNVALLQAVNTLLQRLEQPIEAKIDMYGRGKLYDSMTKADRFMKNKS